MKTEAPKVTEREPAYLRLLIVLLGTATFFEGYDAAITAVVLEGLADSFGVVIEETGKLTGPIIAIGLGAFFALFVTALGDRIGRRPLLISTTLLYALFTGLTATSQSLTQFVIYQFLARVFLVSELATAVTLVAEEYPRDRRGRAMGTLTAMGAFGLPVVAVAYYFLEGSSLDWRALYLIGILPLLLVAILRTRLRESQRWQEARKLSESTGRVSIRRIFASGYRRQLLQVSLVFFFTHAALLGATLWWRVYATTERGFSSAAVTVFLTFGYLLGVSGFFVAGRLQDRIGRRSTGIFFLLAGCTAGIAVFQTTTPTAMFPMMVLAVFFGMGVNPVLNSVVAELFPTEIRATSVAFAKSIFGVLGGVGGPALVGYLADANIGPIGNLADSVSLLVLLYLPAAWILYRLPETAGRELESIVASADIPLPKSIPAPYKPPSPLSLPAGSAVVWERSASSESPAPAPTPSREEQMESDENRESERPTRRDDQPLKHFLWEPDEPEE